MCEIAGIYNKNINIQIDHKLDLMGKILAHRGPDDSGKWIQEENKLGFFIKDLASLIFPKGNNP